MPEQWTHPPACALIAGGPVSISLVTTCFFFLPPNNPSSYTCSSAASRFVCPSPRGGPGGAEACGCFLGFLHHHQVRAALVLDLYSEAHLLPAFNFNIELHCIGISTANASVVRTATYIQIEVHIQLHRLAHHIGAFRLSPLSHLFLSLLPALLQFLVSPIPPLFPVARAQAQTSASSLHYLYLYRLRPFKA